MPEQERSSGAAPAPMPNPGSLEALHQGCTCPQIENHYGHRAPYEPDTRLVAMGCPVHARRAA